LAKSNMRWIVTSNVNPQDLMTEYDSRAPERRQVAWRRL
jgi:hypothetical protein